jgi:hypothetical protein
MGLSQSTSAEICNYNCPVCKESGKIPNLAGRFFIISNTECQCSGCNTVFQKKDYYKSVDENKDEVKVDKNPIIYPEVCNCDSKEDDKYNSVCFNASTPDIGEKMER